MEGGICRESSWVRREQKQERSTTQGWLLQTSGLVSRDASCWLAQVGTSRDGFWPAPSRILPIASENVWPAHYLAWAVGPMLQLDSLAISQSGGQTAIVLFVQNNGLGSFLHMHTICVSASPDSALLLAAKGWEVSSKGDKARDPHLLGCLTSFFQLNLSLLLHLALDLSVESILCDPNYPTLPSSSPCDAFPAMLLVQSALRVTCLLFAGMHHLVYPQGPEYSCSSRAAA